MRIRYFFSFLLLASSLAAQSPLSAIDWLSKENSKFQRSILEITNLDVDKTNDIQVSAMYILGFPTDTNETINKTINYAKKLNTTYAQFSVWTPYPGTPVFNEYKDKITAK